MTFSSDPKLTAQYQSLCMAVGHLFVAWARLEGVMASILKLHLSNNIGTGDPFRDASISSAIYGSMRFSTARDTINRLADTEKMPANVRAALKKIFDQIGVVQSLRDKIAHQQLVQHSAEDDTWRLDDVAVSRDLSNLKSYTIKTADIVNAANDLVSAAERLGGKEIMGPTLFPRDMFDTSPIPWLYKPSMLKSVPRKSGSSRR